MKQLDRRFLGWEEFPDALGEFEIRQFFALSPDELQAVRRRRRPLNRLGVALQIRHMPVTGTPMNSVQMTPGGGSRLRRRCCREGGGKLKVA